MQLPSINKTDIWLRLINGGAVPKGGYELIQHYLNGGVPMVWGAPSCSLAAALGELEARERGWQLRPIVSLQLRTGLLDPAPSKTELGAHMWQMDTDSTPSDLLATIELMVHRGQVGESLEEVFNAVAERLGVVVLFDRGSKLRSVFEVHAIAGGAGLSFTEALGWKQGRLVAPGQIPNRLLDLGISTDEIGAIFGRVDQAH